MGPLASRLAEFDVIVVGAGGSGAPLASRLSEDPDRTVLLLEAGPVPERVEDFPRELLDPGTVQGARPGHANNWSFTGDLTPSLPYSIARGRILGGSTTVNGAYFIRARRQDFDAWSAVAGAEWSWDAALPLYRRIEADADYGETAVHGGSGPIPVERPPQSHPAAVAFAEAAAELGFPAEPDKNDQGEPGYGPVPMNTADGIRQNTGIAYVLPALGRPNLTVRGDTYVRRVVFDRRRAVGVEVRRGRHIEVVHGAEIVLAAGAVKSPHLLMLSGIGPAAELTEHGIPVLVDRPGVGADFSDHPDIAVGWQPRRALVDYSTTQSMAGCLNVAAEGSGAAGDLEILQMLKPMGFLLTGSARGAAAGFASAARHPLSSLRAMRGVSLRRFGAQVAHEGDLSFLVAVQAETSRGRLGLRSADPEVQPHLAYHYLETGSDLRRMREAIRTCVALLRSRAFAPLVGRVTELDGETLDDDTALNAWMRAHLGTAIHLCGSARFGAPDDPDAVVDAHGRVLGVEGLRVADTSILPTTPSRGPAATAVLIGERVADLMRA